jgi:hypothetical protein
VQFSYVDYLGFALHMQVMTRSPDLPALLFQIVTRILKLLGVLCGELGCVLRRSRRSAVRVRVGVGFHHPVDQRQHF